MRFPITFGVLMLAATAFAADNGTWKVAPPPPASWQRDRVADLAARRKAVLDQIGEHAILILYAAEPRNYANDVDWPYRQENDFFYLTGLTQPGATLVLVPAAGKMREMVFLPRAVPARETWTGHMLTPAEVREISGIQDVFDATQLNGLPAALLPRARPVLTAAEGGGGGRGGRGGRGGGEAAPAADVPVWTHGVRQAHRVRRPAGIAALHDSSRAPQRGRVPARAGVRRQTRLRRRRPHHQRRHHHLRQASAASNRSAKSISCSTPSISPPRHSSAPMPSPFPAPPSTKSRRSSSSPSCAAMRTGAIPCIVGSGVNATTLHYEANKDTMKDGDLLLMDDAAEFDQYSVDVTRTIPVNGKFSKEQADIYRLVYDAQQAAFAERQAGPPG